MAKRISAYANLRAHELAQITRERGLEKPDVITLSEWADFLEADDQKRRTAPSGDVERAAGEAAAASGSPSTGFDPYDYEAMTDEQLWEAARVKNFDPFANDPAGVGHEGLIAGLRAIDAEGPQVTSHDYSALSKDEAIAEAERRGMTVTSRTTKAEAVDFLLASDGVSGDQQAADDQAENGDGDTHS